MTLLLGGAAIWERLEQDIRRARDYVYVQTLSLEGDRAGSGVAEALIAAQANEKRVTVDAFTRHFINDRWLGWRSARRDTVLQNEVRATSAMFDRLERNGVPLRFVWPVRRPGYQRLIARNHKKLVVIDDRIAYLGGINFSDHNFAWHDFMVRVDGAELAAHLRTDFAHTWEGRDQDVRAVFGDDEIVIGAGRGNRRMREAVTRVIEGARERIVLHCPYVSQPFWRLLGRAQRRGVPVAIIMPETNNRDIMKWGTLNAAHRHGFDLRLLPGPMTHMKALLVDDTVLGRANSDFISCWHQPEIVLISRQPEFVNELLVRVLEPDLRNSAPMNAVRGRVWRQRFAALGMAIAKPLANLVRERWPSPVRPRQAQIVWR